MAIFDRSGTGTDVSVVLLLSNNETYLKRCLEGIFFQRGVSWDLTVVSEDENSDGMKIVADFVRHSNISGVNYYPIQGFERSTHKFKALYETLAGKYVAFIESNDAWTHPEKLKQQVSTFETRRECSVVCSNYFSHYHPEAQFVARVDSASEQVQFYDARTCMLSGVVWPISTCMYPLELLRQVPSVDVALNVYSWAIGMCLGKYGLQAVLPRIDLLCYAGRFADKLKAESEIKFACFSIIKYMNNLNEGVYQDDLHRLYDAMKHDVSRMEF